MSGRADCLFSQFVDQSPHKRRRAIGERKKKKKKDKRPEDQRSRLLETVRGATVACGACGAKTCGNAG
jgi:hypothetical protein